MSVRAKGSLFHRIAWLVVLLHTTGVVAVSSVHGQGIGQEYKLKAVYLYKFATYIHWPKKAFRNAESPFVIGILGPDPVGVGIRKIADKVQKIEGRKFVVQNYQKPNQIRNCHILYMSRSLAAKEQQQALNLLAKRNILLVGETPDFLDQRGVINFAIQNNLVQVYISKSAYLHENLGISSKLLRIANVMK